MYMNISNIFSYTYIMNLRSVSKERRGECQEKKVMKQRKKCWQVRTIVEKCLVRVKSAK